MMRHPRRSYLTNNFIQYIPGRTPQTCPTKTRAHIQTCPRFRLPLPESASFWRVSKATGPDRIHARGLHEYAQRYSRCPWSQATYPTTRCQPPLCRSSRKVTNIRPPICDQSHWHRYHASYWNMSSIARKWTTLIVTPYWATVRTASDLRFLVEPSWPSP